MDDLAAEKVLCAAELVPPGRVASYGDLAAITGLGPRQVGAVMARLGHAVAWWRVTNHLGRLPRALLDDARGHWREEGIPVNQEGHGCQIGRCRADLAELERDYRVALAEMLATHGTALPRISRPADGALAAAGITTLEQLSDHPRDAIAGLHGMGPKGVRILEEALAAEGWRFRRPG